MPPFCEICQSYCGKRHEPAPVIRDHIYVQFATNGNIRMWKSQPFEGGELYVRQPPKSIAGAEMEIANG